MNNTSSSIKVGDVFLCSWGYDQTNTDFYQAVGLTKASVKVRRIRHSVVETGMMCGQSTPIVNSFIGDEIKTKRINGDGFRVNSYSWAFKTEPTKSHHCSWYH